MVQCVGCNGDGATIITSWTTPTVVWQQAQYLNISEHISVKDHLTTKDRQTSKRNQQEFLTYLLSKVFLEFFKKRFNAK